MTYRQQGDADLCIKLNGPFEGMLGRSVQGRLAGQFVALVRDAGAHKKLFYNHEKRFFRLRESMAKC